MMKFHMVSLGCARNLVDSETMMGRLRSAGWSLTEDPSEAEVIAINTCSFIESAADESIDTILELARYKTEGRCRRLIVAGCLPQRYGSEISAALPEVDAFIGTGAFDKIVEAAQGPWTASACILPDPDNVAIESDLAPRLRTTPHMAYVKVAEGCSRSCTYCIIPRLRGQQCSRPTDIIQQEVDRLLEEQTREIVLIAQDSTAYGTDLRPPVRFSELLKRLASPSPPTGRLEEIPFWIRFLYGHPESIDSDVIRTVAEYKTLCSYFDIPIQHASPSVLKRMGRNYGPDGLYRLFESIRSEDPDAALRTTVIVGFPGETEKDIDRLMDLIRSVRFDHLGVFTYSDSKDLPSHRLSGHVPVEVARDRLDVIMRLQAGISAVNNEKYLDKTVTVLVEEAPEEGLFIGRTAFQAPDVDGITYIRARELEVGEFTRVRITDTLEYDLVGDA